MGCDIHGVWQKWNGSAWEDIESLYEQDRHYKLFGVLSGVRGDEAPIDEPRGLPNDFLIMEGLEDHPVTDISFKDPRRREWHDPDDPLDVWMGDHSHSWLSGDELIGWWDGARPDQREDLDYFFDEVRRLVGLHGKIRFVFGFDS